MSDHNTAFLTAIPYLKNRIAAFTSLPISGIDKLSLGTRLREIGRSEGATSTRPDVA